MKSNRVIKNAGWIVGTQIIKSIAGVVISMLTARYLGPSNYGLINYAASIVTFVAPIMYLGLNGILVQEIVSRPKDEGETIGTAITLSFISSLVCIAGIAAFTKFANVGEVETQIVCALYSILLIFQSIDLIQYWFQAKLLSKYSSVTSLCAYLLVSLYKIYLLITDKSVTWFAISQALDYMIISFTLLVIYKKLGGGRLSFSWSAAKLMLAKSKYYILSNMMIVIFANTDRIMLKLMTNAEMTGWYSAAATCAGMASFVFTAIIDSMRPMIFENKHVDGQIYRRNIVTLYNIIIYGAALYSFVCTVFANYVIKLLYGIAYIPAAGMLQIIVWYCMFSYLGGARDVWILAENKQKYLMLLNATGAVGNVVLNYLLIPIMGGQGAALASLLTQFIVNVALVFVYKPLRPNGFLILEATNPKLLNETIKRLLKREK